ncbi:uncharacterized protein TNCT_195571 [Trichonephila clavata]|uniref:Uncharacterized protein n=1 Tax=Trichonephila clavata TaxID=2740835 RepID=A0A8X6H381_TRICU|nr:uncharacterized protein TNCT_195571 [Trichonephila clavata]
MFLGQLPENPPCTLFRNPNDHPLYVFSVMRTSYCFCDAVNYHSSISPNQFFFTAQLILSQSKLDGHFDLHRQFWNGLAKISSPNCRLLYVIKQSTQRNANFRGRRQRVVLAGHNQTCFRLGRVKNFNAAPDDFWREDSVRGVRFLFVPFFLSFTDCTYPKGGPGGLISPEEISKSILNYSLTWKVPLDCTWVIKVETGWKSSICKAFNLKIPSDPMQGGVANSFLGAFIHTILRLEQLFRISVSSPLLRVKSLSHILCLGYVSSQS